MIHDLRPAWANAYFESDDTRHQIDAGENPHFEDTDLPFLSASDMWAPPEDAEYKIHPDNPTSNECPACSLPRANYHYFDPQEQDEAFRLCLFDRAILYVHEILAVSDSQFYLQGRRVDLRTSTAGMAKENHIKVLRQEVRGCVDHIFNVWVSAMEKIDYIVQSEVMDSLVAIREDIVSSLIVVGDSTWRAHAANPLGQKYQTRRAAEGAVRLSCPPSPPKRGQGKASRKHKQPYVSFMSAQHTY